MLLESYLSLTPTSIILGLDQPHLPSPTTGLITIAKRPSSLVFAALLHNRIYRPWFTFCVCMGLSSFLWHFRDEVDRLVDEWSGKKVEKKTRGKRRMREEIRVELE